MFDKINQSLAPNADTKPKPLVLIDTYPAAETHLQTAGLPLS